MAVLALYIVIGFVFSLPLPFTMNQRIAGDDIDVWINPWVNWWTQKALSEGLPFYHTRYLFYPQGTSLAYHSFFHVNTALWLALRCQLGDLPAYNVIVLASYPLSAFALYLLARRLTGSRSAALLGGFVFGFSPYHVAESAHPGLGTIQWIPLFLLSLENAVTRKKTWSGLCAAFWLWLAGLSGWHLMTMALSLGLFRALYLLFAQRRWREWAVLRTLMISALTFAILILPFLWPLLREVLTSDAPGYALAHQDRFAGTDLLSFFIPSVHHPLLGAAVSGLYEQFYPGQWKAPAFIGFSVLALGMIGIFSSGRKGRFWWICSLVLLGLTLGPYPQVLGRRLFPGYALPWGVAVIRTIRFAHRINTLLVLCWSLLVAWGCFAILQKAHFARFRRRKHLLLAAILTIAGVEYCPIPFPSTHLDVPQFHTELAQEPGDFAILEIPMGRQPSKPYMYYQTVHSKRLVEGHVSRTPADAYAFIDSNPLLSRLGRYSHPDYAGDFSLDFPAVSRQLAALAAAGVRYVIVHHDSTPPELLAAWRSFAFYRPVYDDGDTVVYHTRPIAGVDYEIATHLTREIALVEADGFLPTSASQGSWLHLDLHWTATQRPSRDYFYRVTLHGPSGGATAIFTGAPEWPTSQWPAGTLYTSRVAIQVDPFLPPGPYQITVELIEPATSATVGTPANLGVVEMLGLPREYAHPQPANLVNAVFDDQVRLIGFDVDQSTGALDITLYWQAVRRMAHDYKVFVHVSSTEDGQIAVQDDSMPRRWTYPMSWWDADEIVADRITLDISGLSPGRYDVSVGVYNPETIERLPVVDHTGAPRSDRLLVLPFALDTGE